MQDYTDDFFNLREQEFKKNMLVFFQAATGFQMKGTLPYLKYPR